MIKNTIIGILLILVLLSGGWADGFLYSPTPFEGKRSQHVPGHGEIIESHLIYQHVPGSEIIESHLIYQHVPGSEIIESPPIFLGTVTMPEVRPIAFDKIEFPLSEEFWDRHHYIRIGNAIDGPKDVDYIIMVNVK
jgi:hypothetical protein